MIRVAPNHEKAAEAYGTVKAMNCEYVNVIAKEYPISDTKVGYYIAGISPATAENGVSREQWLAEFEQLNGNKE
ncbi:hypothetical protein [Acinetobacter lwoffii]|uniref:hypothetical protein n=1 Tax=Acinetobacter lwoffii TaxID=28090 RepID=UPI00209B795A|nr:hypothetical protein [Acinetobacter lwoffii]MCO8062375.1 hypothetical protein [Acinetobacter lwoffii]